MFRFRFVLPKRKEIPAPTLKDAAAIRFGSLQNLYAASSFSE
ncbi:hypothetical protein HVIM_04220 [Roseomonas mucosa]|nr:hypothetical protein HVIM_04220 [Roseomonas mucosa]QDD99028.1 hypothetical protein ADP8_04220 [Roseomonas mucosa]UZO91221.1 hypothetical protein RMP42_04220 [Roseomonas mucosa]